MAYSDIKRQDLYAGPKKQNGIIKFIMTTATKIVYGFLETKVRNGVALYLGDDDLLFVKNNKDEPLAIYQKKDDGKHHCLRGLF